MIKTVICYLEKGDKVLMLYRNKKENDLNGGKYIGVGGHVEKGETIEDAVIREVKEETNLDIVRLDYFGKVIFYIDDYTEEMYVFTSSEFTGELSECDEGTLYWVDKNKILDLPLWEGDKYFIELIKSNIRDFEICLTYKNDKLINVNRVK